ncbi:MAG: site-2 protease family protein [Halobacteriovoraceae bacterium]|nr:site-2 protease family protein [Halobacteriovoraceae bacterium]MBT5096102.1 site-2 protease family protein [Halobacteriovoraceae bacterium]
MKFGDDTAKNAGRLSFNPVVHLDPVGTVIIPIVFIVLGMGMFGYAKPVPVNQTRFKNYKQGMFWVAFAGPIANLILMVLFCFLTAAGALYIPQSFAFKTVALQMMNFAILINVVLALFNLIPWPPLDGSQMVKVFMDYNTARKYENLERFTLILFIFLWWTHAFRYIMRPAAGFANYILNSFIYALG